MKFLTSPMLYLLLFAIAGMAAITAGIYILAGIGWAFISGGIQFLACAALISRGLNYG